MVHVTSTVRPVAQPVSTITRARTAATKTSHTAGTSTTAGGSTAAGASTDSGAADFLALFTSKTSGSAASNPPPPQAPPPPAPTAQSAFGPNPWISNPTGIGPNGATYSYNPYYFATAQTAATVAQMVGGKVVQSNQFTASGGPFQQQQPNYMVQLADGRMINPGLVASFYDHGYPQSYVDMMVACEVQNA